MEDTSFFLMRVWLVQQCSLDPPLMTCSSFMRYLHTGEGLLEYGTLTGQLKAKECGLVPYSISGQKKEHAEGGLSMVAAGVGLTVQLLG